MRTNLLWLFLLTLSPNAIIGFLRRQCGTNSPNQYELQEVARVMDEWRTNNITTRGMNEHHQGVNVIIHWHTITKGEKGILSQSVINQSIDVLNGAFAPHFTFFLESVDTTDNRQWWHLDKTKDDKMKKALRKGDCSTLNIYSTELMDGMGGWASLPFGCADDLDGDGVVISYGTTPGGYYIPYNEGDNLVHETGHWLGLYHTFEKGEFKNGCDGEGDQVADTPAVAYPNYNCKPIDSCPNDGQGNDQVENYMDYGYDACMSMFTEGQFTRMVAFWYEYRSDKNPYNSPTASPSIAGHDCKPNEQPLMIEIKTDYNNTQNKVVVKKKKSRKRKDFIIKELGKNMKENALNVFHGCVKPNRSCYVMIISDKKGDGICCQYGEGFYAIYINGSQLIKRRFERGRKRQHVFGKCRHI